MKYIASLIVALAMTGTLFACDPPTHLAFGKEAEAQLRELSDTNIVDRIILYTNLAAYTENTRASDSARILLGTFLPESRSTLLRAYAGALQAIELRDRNGFSKLLAYCFGGGMDAFRKEAKIAIDSISLAFVDAPNDEVIRLVRIAIALEALQVLPDSGTFQMIRSDLQLLEMQTDTTCIPRQFFIQLFWAKYQYFVAKREQKKSAAELGIEHLQRAYAFACTDFYKSEVTLWSGRLYLLHAGLN